MTPTNRNKGKGGREVLLPNRAAMNKLVANKPGQPPPSIMNFAAATPDGLTAPQTYPQLVQLGLKGAKIR